MVSSIRRVGRQFKNGRQEDAHEYLRQLLDCMHEEILKANGRKLSDGKIAETTLICRVFGGYLCNELSCSQCSYSSKTFNLFQDLSLEVSGGISSVAGALKAFIKPEKLSSGNEWKCDGCSKKVQGTVPRYIKPSPLITSPSQRTLCEHIFQYISNETTDHLQVPSCLGHPFETFFLWWFYGKDYQTYCI